MVEKPMNKKSYDIYIDTGGTFTDCIGQDPDGTWIRRKVLSNGSLRGVIQHRLDSKTLIIKENWGLTKDILRGYRFKLLDIHHEVCFIQCYDVEKNILRLTREIPAEGLSGSRLNFEISSGEEAPVLGARLITGTALDLDLPPLRMKLASTRGTNALLERKGADFVLFVTRGFRDILEIGDQQRPDIFALNVNKRKMLYTRIVEVEERIDSSGKVLLPLDTGCLEKDLQKLRRKGFHSAAICLLNAYVNPKHENELASYLKPRGMDDISLSSELSGAIKYIDRTETAVVNAYLSPVFRSYLQNIRSAIPFGRIHVMTSSGGLVRGEEFKARDSLLSGPAGGVVGAVTVGKGSGVDHLISFDMGGTSTDVSRYDAEFDYRYTLEVGDARILSPALSIETVAAGGGSLCYFDGFKLCVGPESAGANPGPACYGAGGPLTLTDVNLLLGHLDPREFGIPVFREQAENRLSGLIRAILEQSGKNYSREEILTGFYDIANELMAGAIRNISIAKGYDPAGYVLLAFGGAGGMHACRIARLLGINRVIVPSDAGLLSAYGLAYARIERFAERQVLKPFREVAKDLSVWIGDLEKQSVEAVKTEGVPGPVEVRIRTVFMRFLGQDESLPVTWAEGADLPVLFRQAYTRLYGHWTENREMEVESIRVLASEQHDYSREKEVQSKTYSPEPSGMLRSFTGDQWKEVPLYRRSDLRAGARIRGQALLIDPYSTTLIEPGWEMTIEKNGSAVLRQETSRKVKEEKSIRESRLELFTNRFKFIAENMGAMLQRTALSVNIKERLDFSCALLCPDGYLVANAPHIPVHLGSLGVCLRSLKGNFNMEAGDTLITNHPAFGGSHLPDITLITPVFSSGMELLGYVANRAHHAELGGTRPASMPPDAKKLEEEGVVIYPFHLVRKGIPDWDGMRRILETGPWPSRTPEENLADLNAALAANVAGAKGLGELAGKYSARTVTDYMKYLREYAACRMRQTLQKIPDGRYQATENLDDGSCLKVNVRVRGDRCIIDFSGTSPVHPGNMNANRAIVNSVVIYVLRLLLNEPLPLNEGFMEPVRLILPECLLNPDFDRSPDQCPAIVGGNVEVSQRLTDTLLKAFGVAACSQGTMNNIMLGNRSYSYYETVCGGCGAGDGFPGASAVHHHMTNTRITDPEILEKRYPLRLLEFSIRRGSGGKGKYRGGNGAVRILEFTEESSVSILSQHRVVKPYGMNGGGEGKRGTQYLIRSNGEKEPLKGMDGATAFPGDRLVVKSPGGGGFGTRE